MLSVILISDTIPIRGGGGGGGLKVPAGSVTINMILSGHEFECHTPLGPPNGFS